MVDRRARLARASALQQAGDFAAAERAYRRLLKDHPGDAGVLYHLGLAGLQQGKFAAGRHALEQALRREPDNPDILFSLGRAQQAMGEHDGALHTLQTARDRAPDRSEIWAALGDTLQQLKRPDEAVAAYARALELRPDDWRVFANAALVPLSAGNLDAGAAMLRQLAGNRRHPKVLLNLALAEQGLGNYEAAGPLFEELATLEPGNADVQAGRALHLQRIGRTHDAWNLLRGLAASAFRRPLPVLAFARIAPQHDNADRSLSRRAVTQIEALLAEPALPGHQQAALNFARGRLYDRLDRCDQAFDAIAVANALSPARYDAQALERRFDRLRSFFTAERFATLARSSVRSARPLFIVGMPRSGTSLVEQILDTHPEVAGGGELTEIWAIERELNAAEAPERLSELRGEDLDPFAQRYLKLLHDIDPAAARVSDKLPANFERLGLIALLLPGARVVHCVRDPLDTCLSCYFQDFRYRNAYSFSLEHLGHYYAQYAALMRHWQAVLPLPIHEVRYEALVARPAETVAALLEFCGLPWDGRCLAFHENPRVVATASGDQVRRPLYTDAVGRAARYRHRLGPLVQALAVHGVALPDAAD